jgi:pimeloyl-ACP methyl ester carboxylesterase
MDNESGRVWDEIVTLDGLRFHYRDWGDSTAPPVVVLHGYTQHAHSWDTIARALADRFRVLALDQRGFGESDWAADYHELRLVADLAGFVEALGLPTVSLVGFSIGGIGGDQLCPALPRPGGAAGDLRMLHRPGRVAAHG